MLAMGEELKVYIPSLIQPVLRLFLQDSSEHKLATQKVKMLAVVAIVEMRVCELLLCEYSLNKCFLMSDLELQER